MSLETIHMLNGFHETIHMLNAATKCQISWPGIRDISCAIDLGRIPVAKPASCLYILVS